VNISDCKYRPFFLMFPAVTGVTRYRVGYLSIPVLRGFLFICVQKGPVLPCFIQITFISLSFLCGRPFAFLLQSEGTTSRAKANQSSTFTRSMRSQLKALTAGFNRFLPSRNAYNRSKTPLPM